MAICAIKVGCQGDLQLQSRLSLIMAEVVAEAVAIMCATKVVATAAKLAPRDGLPLPGRQQQRQSGPLGAVKADALTKPQLRLSGRLHEGVCSGRRWRLRPSRVAAEDSCNSGCNWLPRPRWLQ